MVSYNMDLVPSLQQYCYDLLAEYSGYIEDLDGVYITGVKEICVRSNPFGLANIEDLMASSPDLDTDEFWERIYNENPEKYKCENDNLIKGKDFYRNIVMCCELRDNIQSFLMDDDDLLKFIGLASHLKLLELHSMPRLSPSIIFPNFSNLLHLSLSNSKLGPSISSDLQDLLLQNPCLASLNLNNLILTDSGLLPLLPAISQSKLISLILSWNDLTLDSIQSVLTICKSHPFLSLVNLSNNVKRKDVIAYTKAKNEVIKCKNIKIT